MASDPVTHLAPIDYAVMAVYFAAVLGVGWSLRRGMRTSTDFFLSGRSLSPWITGVAFISANLGVDEALRLTLAAVQASGLQHNELWSYEVKQGRLLPIRYGTSGDVQLWNTTNLVVQYVLSKLPPTN